MVIVRLECDNADEVFLTFNSVMSRENLILVRANNKGADQTAHLRSLISAFIIRYLESTISELATRKFAIF